jgi:hypothetical protein
MMMFVINALVGLFHEPPSRSVYWATAGEQVASNSTIKDQQRRWLTRFLFIFFDLLTDDYLPDCAGAQICLPEPPAVADQRKAEGGRMKDEA